LWVVKRQHLVLDRGGSNDSKLTKTCQWLCLRNGDSETCHKRSNKTMNWFNELPTTFKQLVRSPPVLCQLKPLRKPSQELKSQD
jgi:hypothetical protein